MQTDERVRWGIIPAIGSNPNILNRLKKRRWLAIKVVSMVRN
jgi:hypothetical protein